MNGESPSSESKASFWNTAVTSQAVTSPERRTFFLTPATIGIQVTWPSKATRAPSCPSGTSPSLAAFMAAFMRLRRLQLSSSGLSATAVMMTRTNFFGLMPDPASAASNWLTRCPSSCAIVRSLDSAIVDSLDAHQWILRRLHGVGLLLQLDVDDARAEARARSVPQLVDDPRIERFALGRRVLARLLDLFELRPLAENVPQLGVARQVDDSAGALGIEVEDHFAVAAEIRIVGIILGHAAPELTNQILDLVDEVGLERDVDVGDLDAAVAELHGRHASPGRADQIGLDRGLDGHPGGHRDVAVLIVPAALERELADRFDLDGPSAIIGGPGGVDVRRGADPGLVVPVVDIGWAKVPVGIILLQDLDDDRLELAPALQDLVVLFVGDFLALERPEFVGRQVRMDRRGE